MQYIQYWKINQNLQLFVIFPTHAKYIRFWKKKMSIKQRLRVGGDFCPQPYFFQLRSHLRRYYSGGGQPDFAPPLTDFTRIMVVVPRKAYDIYRGSEIIEFLREIFCNAEIFINPLQKIWSFLQWIMLKLKTMNSWKVEGWKFISEIWSFFYLFLKIKMKGLEGACSLFLLS